MNSRIKLSARAALTGSQIRVVPLVAAIMTLVLFFSFFNAALNRLPLHLKREDLMIFAAVSLVAFVAAVSPLRLFLQIRMLMLARGINHAIKPDIGFIGAAKACGMSVCLFLLKFFWLAVFEAIPVAGAVMIALKGSREALSLRASYAVISGIAVLAFAGLAFYAVFIQRYSKAMFYLACYKDFGIADALRESIKRTEGRAVEILFFKLGFAPWLLLCAGILPALYVIPYYKQSVTCFFLSR